MSSSVIKLIKKNESLGMNTLIERCIKKKYKVGVFQSRILNGKILEIGENLKISLFNLF